METTPQDQAPLNGSTTKPVSGMYEDYFLNYASYVILERAVPMLDDGLKPVQRRIFHSMKEMDDGRFNKVANIIGQTMQYHPHGDAAIGEALVNLGQKDLMIECQGNWGDVRTGDSAAAARYIEARLSKFALEVAFNPKITTWQLSYDGRKREPVALPVKFPLVLAQGVEGIAVGLATKILPHNFCELIQASIDLLKGKSVKIYPDFPTGGMADVTQYESGQRGGRVRCRALIETIDKSTLAIKGVPFGVTTGTLIDSILKANDKGKIKIKKVVDNTAADVEVLVELAPGMSPDVAVDGLYAFSECEVSISPNTCVIINDKPYFLPVEELLRLSTNHTRELLRKELEIRLEELKERLLFSSLEKIFIENRIYRDIEECETWEAVIQTIDKGLEPYKPLFYRVITEEDILRLTEIKIKRISKFDSFKADELIRQLDEDIAETEYNLAHIVDYAVKYFQNLLTKYGKGKERQTEIRTFDTIEVRQVAVANEKLYVNRKEGFIGFSLKKDEFISDCSDIDDIIIIRGDGKYLVTRVSEKAFVGKDIIHAAVWKKGDERMVYHAIYRDPQSGNNYVKRFAVTAITRDREYDITNGAPGTKVIYFSVQPNSESEIVNVQLSPTCRAKIKVFDFDFGTIAIKGRSSQGNVLSKYPIKKIVHKAVGASTLGGRKIWLDETVGRLNVDKRGKYLGEFDTEDRIVLIFKDGSYELTDFELTNRYEMDKLWVIEKFNPETVISAVYLEGQQKVHYVKRFQIETSTTGKKFSFISDTNGSKLDLATTHPAPIVHYEIPKKGAKPEKLSIEVKEFMDVKGWKAIGNRLDRNLVSKVTVELPEIVQELQVGDEIEWSGDEVYDGKQGDLFS